MGWGEGKSCYISKMLKNNMLNKEVNDGNEYLDKEVYVTASGALQERMFVKRIVHRKGTKDAERIMKSEKYPILFLARIFANFASLW
ncbi:hypothetical protein BAC3_01716 [uncultured bacterium]|nr:hypothetical protein BAC3_01716 [uncultured bacterium]